MKVAYVLPYLARPSGWRTHSLGLINAISQLVEPVLFVAQADLAAAQELFPALPLFNLPVTQHALPTSPQGARALLACHAAIRSGRFPPVDLVHSLEAFPTGWVGSWLADRLGCPHALTTHGTYGVIWRSRPVERGFYQRVLSRSALVCPVSVGSARMLKQTFGASLTHSHLRPILNGNDFYKAIPRGEALRRRPPEIPTLLSVGDVKPRKGQHVSLAAFALVKEEFPTARYLIAGQYSDNDYYRYMQQTIADYSLRDVHFLGRVSDEELHRCYREASLFVLTPQPGVGPDKYHFEGFGLVYLEAGAYGLPVVASRVGGVPDAVRHAETGFLVEPDDVSGLAGAIVQLLDNVALWRSMGQANRMWAESLTWERCAGEHYQAYCDVLGRS
ncbi:MAG: glycosyltransferase family 4 protein [Anaerolineales bacterium]|nr:glycosyltransferase family 4 protein [Anaerolineales bacterium]